MFEEISRGDVQAINAFYLLVSNQVLLLKSIACSDRFSPQTMSHEALFLTCLTSIACSDHFSPHTMSNDYLT